jgi:hypothetical protein
MWLEQLAERRTKMKTLTVALTIACAAALICQANAKEPCDRVVDEAVVWKLCPHPNMRCKVRDNPDFYKEDDPALYNSITKCVKIEIPDRFRGEWIDDNDDPMKMKVTADGIRFGSSPAPACKFTDVKVADENGLTYAVTWRCPDFREGVEVKEILRLMKAWGKQVLVLVNAESPTAISIFQRAH